MKKRIITAAVTGSVYTPSMTPYLPITPREIADEVIRSHQAGASVAHIHVRDPDTGMPTSRIELFQEVASRVKKQSDIVLCFTTGGAPGMSIEERVKVITVFHPELASLNFGSINFAIFHALDSQKKFKHSWEEEFIRGTEDNVFANSFKNLREYCYIFEQNNTKPEIEIYDVNMINNLAFMIRRGHVKKPVYLEFVLGVLGGMPASIDNLLFLYNTARNLLGDDFEWSVCAVGRDEIPMCTTNLILGGHVRVGLEDAIHLEKGIFAKSNAELVEKIVRIAQELGIEPATPNEARQILGLKGLDKVLF
jgi:uncharacterized protein (DUF849 family)